MRTKTLFLSAAALLAAGIVSSQAQPVYSQNVVGYATVTFPAALTMAVVPFQVGVSNGANEIFGTNLPDQTVINAWNTGTSKFVTAEYDTQGGFGTSPNNWYLGDDVTPGPIPVLSPGKGFFISVPTPLTNSFAGVVAINVGATNNLNLPAALTMVGSVLPVAGAITNGIINLGTNLPDQTVINTWNTGTSKFITAEYDTQGGFGTSPNNWYLGDDVTPGPVPVITVGQAFFISLPQSFTWSETLPSN